MGSHTVELTPTLYIDAPDFRIQDDPDYMGWHPTRLLRTNRAPIFDGTTRDNSTNEPTVSATPTMPTIRTEPTASTVPTAPTAPFGGSPTVIDYTTVPTVPTELTALTDLTVQTELTAPKRSNDSYCLN
jgi:hypothetical protein